MNRALIRFCLLIVFSLGMLLPAKLLAQQNGNKTRILFLLDASGSMLAQMDKATLNNMETMGIQFVTLCLRPWAVQVEQEFAVKLLTQTELYSETYFD